MAVYQCCVGGCDSTSNTHRLFCMPVNDKLRDLWMSFLVRTNPTLLILTKNQLLKKRVCAKHFDETQFDEAGVRIRYSYPCLMTDKEIVHGIPLSNERKLYEVGSEHNYCSVQEQESNIQDTSVVNMGMQGDVLLPEQPLHSSSNTTAVTSKMQYEGDCSTYDHQYAVPSTSKHAFNQNMQDVGDVLLPKQPSHSSANTTAVTSEMQYEGEVLGGQSSLLLTSNTVSTKKKTQMKTDKSLKQFNSKTRRFIKECTNVTSKSMGSPGKERIENAVMHAESQVLIENFSKMNKKAKAFLLMQLKLARKNKMARRFSLQEKLLALTLLKQSPKGYKLLEKMFALPNRRTLARLSEKINFESGINENIFKHIETSIRGWDTKKKICSVVFDEVALTPNLVFNESKGKINGFVEIADERKQKLCDHALVFMIRGICSGWRQCIAYYFCEGTISSVELQKILKKMIPCLIQTGLKPVAIVCDQGSTFRSCFKILKEDSVRFCNMEGKNYDGTVRIAGHNLFFFYDAPHLLKGIRNNFLEKDIAYEGKTASWKDILYIYDLDSKSGHTRALPKLTAENVDAKKIKKMKVKAAAQVLSARTAAMLHFTHEVHKRFNDSTKTMKMTAEVVEFFDELFDSVNGSPGGTKGKLRCAVKPNSPHQDFWTNAILKLRKIKFIDATSKLSVIAGKPRHVRVPSLEGWITTLESFLGLSKLLFSEFGVEYFYPRCINQDPLENFFGRIRALNYRNTNPDVNTFVYAYKSLVLSNILSPHSKNANCEEDDGDSIINFNNLFNDLEENKENLAPPLSSNTDTSLTAPSSSNTDSQIKNAIDERVRVQISAYTAGYICRKITKKFNCNLCAKTYTAKEVEGIHKFIKYREFKRLKNSNLAYPNELFLILYRKSSEIIHHFLNSHAHNLNIKNTLRQKILQENTMSWLGCQTHKKYLRNYFTSLIIRLQVHHWCNIINRILRGKTEEKYILKNEKMHMMALNKYKTHRLRKSKLNK